MIGLIFFKQKCEYESDLGWDKIKILGMHIDHNVTYDRQGEFKNMTITSNTFVLSCLVDEDVFVEILKDDLMGEIDLEIYKLTR
jgi:hypothetical protein